MIKSPPLRNLTEFVEYVRDNQLEDCLDGRGPQHYPFVVITDVDMQQGMEFVYIEDFAADNAAERIFLDFARDYYPVFYKNIQKPKVMKKAVLGPLGAPRS